MVQIPKWQVILTIVVLILGLAYAFPNLLSKDSLSGIADPLPNKQISLGLDLQGGAYLVMEVQLEKAVTERLESSEEFLRRSLRQERIGYRGHGVQDNTIVFQLREAADLDKAKELAQTVEGGGGGLLGGGAAVLVSGEGDTLRVEYLEDTIRQIKTTIMAQAIEVLRRRIDEFGLREASLQRQGEDRIILQMPGVSNPEEIKNDLLDVAKLTFHMVNEAADPSSGRPPPGHLIFPSDDDGRLYVVEKLSIVSGENLEDAQATFDQYGQPVISFRFDAVGAAKFGRITKENVGRLFAIVLDDRIISAPVIREPILGGSGQISGNFTVESAEALARLLRAGALPADLTFLEERTVGASLGADSIDAGKIASILGLVFVIIFMAAAYGTFGLMANVALLSNLVLIVAALSVLQATLTLPGIAGIVLTIGMAVDANVLIFERIREEERSGRGPVTAIDTGYRRALTTIIDSNLTTLIAALILISFGTGPIKGFAVTLSIGLVTSMFTAIMVTRLLVTGWLRRLKPKALPI